MPKTETVFARLSLACYQDEFRLEETRDNINARLFDVMTDDFYLKKFTELVAKFQPADMEKWVTYKKNPTSANRYEGKIEAIAKFAVTDQKVDLVEIRFH